MSQRGVKLAAEVFSFMQSKRQELLNMGGTDCGTKSGIQDLMLGQLFQTANDAIKDDFAKLVCMDIKPSKKGSGNDRGIKGRQRRTI